VYNAPRSLWRTGPSSNPTPSHVRSPSIASSPPGTVRAGSVSSIRSTSTPSCSSANRRFATAGSPVPTGSEPVGVGGKRTGAVTPRNLRGEELPDDRSRTDETRALRGERDDEFLDECPALGGSSRRNVVVTQRIRAAGDNGPCVVAGGLPDERIC